MILLSLLSLLFATEFSNTLETHGNSSINWTQMRLEGTAYVEQNGASDDYAKQEARALALAHQALKETFDHFQIDTKTSMDDISAADSKTQRYILANAKKYKVAQTSYKESGGVSVNVYWDIHTLMRPIILSRSSELTDVTKPKKHTGIIIDARGVDHKPMLFPEIATDEEQHWLSVKGFSRKAAETKLPFIYAPHAAHQMVIDRVGQNPVIFLAKSASANQILIDTSFPNGLSSDDAKAIMALGNVAILLEI